MSRDGAGMSGAAGAGERTNLHASCVAVEGEAGWRALLILGPSGSGKSALALDLISRGARLVADDRTDVALRDGRLVASAPAAIAGMIEARGMGLLRLPWIDGAEVAVAADLSATETERLPQARELRLLDVTVPRILCAGNPGAAPALMALLRGGGLVA